MSEGDEFRIELVVDEDWFEVMDVPGRDLFVHATGKSVVTKRRYCGKVVKRERGTTNPGSCDVRDGG